MDDSINEKGSTNTGTSSGSLTVIVLNDKGQPSSGARVSITPSDASGITDQSGEIVFKLGGAKKYDVTASYGSNTVTVPYYVTKNGATRLVVNPVYVRSVERQLHRSSLFSTQHLTIAGVGLGAIIVLVILWKLFRRK